MGMSARCVYVCLDSCHHIVTLASFSGLPVFCSSVIIHESRRAAKNGFSALFHFRVILNANQRTKNWKGLGTRLSSLMCAINHSTFHSFIYQSDLFSTLHGVPVVSWGSHEVQENRNLSGVCPAKECLPDMPLR